MSLPICNKCVHYRSRAKPYMGSDFDKRNPASIRIIEKWEQEYEDRRRWEDENARKLFDGNMQGAIDYEPYHYPWCDLFSPYDALLRGEMKRARDNGDLKQAKELAVLSITRGKLNYTKAQSGDSQAIDDLIQHMSITINPVSGEISQVYALCAIINYQSQCLLFEPGEEIGKAGRDE